MTEQLALFDVPRPSPDKFRLFLGVFPDEKAVERIEGIRARAVERHQLSGKPRPREILHATLHHLGDFSAVPGHVAQAAGKACQAATAGVAPFKVTLNRTATWANRPGNCPFVLIGGEEANVTLKEFHCRLIGELARHGLARAGEAGLTPHVTMLYHKNLVPEERVEPVCWWVKEIVLVCSHLGRTHYERLDSWMLGRND